jgi:hypothetical protein
MKTILYVIEKEDGEEIIETEEIDMSNRNIKIDDICNKIAKMKKDNFVKSFKNSTYYDLLKEISFNLELK